jgi:hypothetical protein
MTMLARIGLVTRRATATTTELFESIEAPIAPVQQDPRLATTVERTMFVLKLTR